MAAGRKCRQHGRSFRSQIRYYRERQKFIPDPGNSYRPSTSLAGNEDRPVFLRRRWKHYDPSKRRLLINVQRQCHYNVCIFSNAAERTLDLVRGQFHFIVSRELDRGCVVIAKALRLSWLLTVNWTAVSQCIVLDFGVLGACQIMCWF